MRSLNGTALTRFLWKIECLHIFRLFEICVAHFPNYTRNKLSSLSSNNWNFECQLIVINQGGYLVLLFLKQDNNRLFFEFLCALEGADYLCIKYLVINQDSILFLWYKSYKGVKAIRIGFPLVYYVGKVTRLSSDINVAYKRCIEWTSTVELRKTNWRSIEQVEMTSLNVIICLPNIYLLWLITQMSKTCHLKPCIGHLMHFLVCSLSEQNTHKSTKKNSLFDSLSK